MGSVAFNPVVSKLIRSYRQAYPNVTLTLTEGNTAQLLAHLDAGRVDVAFVRLGSQSPAGVQINHIAIEPMKIVLPATHKLAKKRKVPLAALADDPFVMLPREASPTLHDVIIGACREAGFEPVPGQQAPQLSSVVNLVAAEFGVSLVPASVCQIQIDGVAYTDALGSAITIRLALASRIDATAAKTANFLDIARQVVTSST